MRMQARLSRRPGLARHPRRERLMTSKERFLKACGNQVVDRPPVWIMRQAGRALPEYNELREKHSFWEICTTPELAAMVSLQPVRRFSLDAVIIFSDILVVPAAMGVDVSFYPELSLSPRVQTKGDLAGLKTDGAVNSLKYVADVIRNVNSEVGEDLAVLGFSGAPYTLACYMIEGGSSKDYHRVKGVMYRETYFFEDLLEKIAEVVADYLEMQVESGVTAVQLFDTWAAEMSPDDFERLELPCVKRIVERLRPKGVPVIYYINGMGSLLELAHSSGADILGIDWRTGLSEVRRRLGADRVLQGNLDPAVLLAPEDVIREKVFNMLDETEGRGHIVNLGHGLLPRTPLEGIEAFVGSVHEWAER